MLRRLRRMTSRGADRGLTLAEFPMQIVLLGILVGVVVSAVIWATRTSTAQTYQGDVWAEAQDASTQLMRDVTDASAIVAAEPDVLTVLVVRDEKCQQREWTADPASKTLAVATTFFDQTACAGGSEKGTDVVIGAGADPKRGWYTSRDTFTYFEPGSETALAVPVEPDRVRRVAWSLTVQAGETGKPRTLTGGAAFTGTGNAQAGTGDVENAKKPVLCRALRTADNGRCGPVPSAASPTGKIEGRDKPILYWLDPSPTVTRGWTVWRVANPDDMAANDPARTTWKNIAYIPAAGTTWFVDSSLPDGYTAQYVVRPVIDAGVGPSSDQVVTGLRPAKTTGFTADGQQQQIVLRWDEAVGAIGYDVYRDDKLVANVGATTTFIDKPGVHGWSGIGYGHSHNYRVVAVNQWESVMLGADAGATPWTVRQALGGASTITPARLLSDQDGDFTAAAAPTAFTAQSTAGTRNDVVSWTRAGWVGAGPTTVDGVSRDQSWKVYYRTSDKASTTLASEANTKTSYTWGSRPAGRYTEYVVQVNNPSGSGQYPAWQRTWQRPAVPACTASSVTTRSAKITAQTLAATVDETYTASSQYEVKHDRKTGDSNQTGWQPNGTVIDPLRHNSARTFDVRVKGNGGWSDAGSCSTTTQLLAVRVASTWSESTRTVRATQAPTNGNDRHLVLEGGAVASGVPRDQATTSATWDPVRHNTTYTVRAVNSDGYNRVEATASTRTRQLIASNGRQTSRTTRSVGICFDAADGNSRYISLGSRTISGTCATFDPLRDDAGYSWTATNSDGYNDVSVSGTATTSRLARPVAYAPSCSIGREGRGEYARVSHFNDGGAAESGYYRSGSYFVGWTRDYATNSDGYNSYTDSDESSCRSGVVYAVPTCPAGSNTSVTASLDRYSYAFAREANGGLGGNIGRPGALVDRSVSNSGRDVTCRYSRSGMTVLDSSGAVQTTFNAGSRAVLSSSDNLDGWDIRVQDLF
jgi:hypothetical protein